MGELEDVKKLISRAASIGLTDAMMPGGMKRKDMYINNKKMRIYVYEQSFRAGSSGRFGEVETYARQKKVLAGWGQTRHQPPDVAGLGDPGCIWRVE